MSIKSEYKSTLKSSDTEEWFDLVFYRPIGFGWAVLARKLGVTPNAITIASIFIGIAAGICFYPNNMWINIMGIFLLVWANSFDSADGQLARLTGQYSRLGRILDGAAGDFWFISIYICICLREVHTSSFFMAHNWLIWVIAVAAGLCHSLQAAQADYYRQLHLFFLKGKEGSELDSSDKLRKKLAEMPQNGNFFSRLVLKFYIGYTSAQESRTPAMQRFRKVLVSKFGGGAPSATFRERFRQASLPLMKYTNILSFNTRCFALFIAIAVRMPWLYFAFELTVLNVVLVYMVVRHESICKRFTRELTHK
ncbi:MAG: CDP-alcohol phosphatidyltransferase family protein [Muribaculaceae bacterium]|nr:CDP-alcohol phosphatidyltransferase family protein [Muribaculaceae bacterium]